MAIKISGSTIIDDSRNISNAGIITATSLSSGSASFTELLKEKVNIVAGRLSANTNINVADGMVHYFTTAENTTCTPNIRYDASTTLNSMMSIGETVAVTLITTAAAAGYSAQLNVDGSGVTERWIGGEAPTEGGTSGVDIYSYQLIKTGNNAYTVIANVSKTSV